MSGYILSDPNFSAGKDKDVAVFAILVIVLIFRPTGLLGSPDVEKV